MTKYLKGAEGVSTEDRVRIFRLIEKLAFESRDIVSNIHGGGSPETHRMTILRNANIDEKKTGQEAGRDQGSQEEIGRGCRSCAIGVVSHVSSAPVCGPVAACLFHGPGVEFTYRGRPRE